MDLKKFSVYYQPAESKTILDSYTQDLQSLNAKITDLLSLNESFEELRTDLSQCAKGSLSGDWKDVWAKAA